MPIRKHEVFECPQEERPAKLLATVTAWLAELEPGEKLIVGLPEVTGTWEECVPLILGPQHRDAFPVWFEENQAEIRGPHYNLSPLNAGFLCMISDLDFDPRVEQVADDDRSLQGVLYSMRQFLHNAEREAAVALHTTKR